MIRHSIIEEVLLCLQQTNLLSLLAIPTQILMTATAISDLIFVVYVSVALITKRAFYLLAFFFAESFSYLSVIQEVAAHDYYGRMRYFAVFFFVAYFIYFVAKRLKINEYTLVCYGIMSAFMATMTYNGLAYPKGTSDGETFLYQNYEYIVLLIHLLTAVSTINFRKIRNFMGLPSFNWRYIFHYSYTH